MTLELIDRAGHEADQVVDDERLNDEGDDLDHIHCCIPDTAMCGADISNSIEVPPEFEFDHPCVVCHELTARACERCGA